VRWSADGQTVQRARYEPLCVAAGFDLEPLIVRWLPEWPQAAQKALDVFLSLTLLLPVLLPALLVSKLLVAVLTLARVLGHYSEIGHAQAAVIAFYLGLPVPEAPRDEL
jgi:hypothetical protein